MAFLEKEWYFTASPNKKYISTSMICLRLFVWICLWPQGLKSKLVVIKNVMLVSLTGGINKLFWKICNKLFNKPALGWVDFLRQKEECVLLSLFPPLCPGLTVLAQRCRCTMCSMAVMVISQWIMNAHIDLPLTAVWYLCVCVNSISGVQLHACL